MESSESRHAPARQPRRVLVVDNHDDCRATLSDLLRLHGFEPVPCRNGDEAIVVAGALRPHAVLLELVMPGRDGFATARAMRAQAQTRDTFIAALTGLSRAVDRQRAREAGIDSHLCKPYDPLLLIDLLRSIA